MGRIGKGWDQRIWSGAVGLLCALAAGALSFTPLVERWELSTQDRRVALRGRRPTGARVVIAGISDSTFSAWPEPMVFWGAHHAAAIRKARGLGARWIGLDFVQGVSGGVEADQKLALALSEGRVVLSQFRFTRGGSVNPIPSLLYAHPQQPENVGFVDSLIEVDGAMRRALVFHPEAGRLVPSFAALLALRFQGQSPTDEHAVRGLLTVKRSRAGGGAVWINPVGPPGSFPSLPVERLAAGRLTEVERNQVRGAVVFIGPVYSGSNDLHRGPGGAEYSGMELNAHVLATLLDHRPLLRAPRRNEAMVTAAVGGVLAVAVTFLPAGWGLLLVCLAGGAWWWGAMRAIHADQIWPTAGPLLAMGLTWAGHYVARSLEEARRRLRMQRLFGRYVTPEIVDYLLRHPSHLELGGKESDVSVLFVDIRGHTTAAQRQKPSEAMAELNELFCQIVPVIQRHGGLIYGYRGDGFLSVFGAPRPLDNHAQSAVDAAVEAVQVTRRISAGRVRDGKDAVRIGSGINSGVAVCGNLGDGVRSEWTAIGDTVNTAARLEQLNKAPELNAGAPSEIVISQETYQRLQRLPPVRGPFSFEIRGREGQMLVYGVEVSVE